MDERFTQALRSLLPCAKLRPLKGDWLAIDSLFTFPDGDTLVIHAKETAGGGVLLSDRGHTMMQLSYIMDVDRIREGRRSHLLDMILANHGVTEDGGELTLSCPLPQVMVSFFSFGQALTRVHDVGFASKAHVESNFYNDLQSVVEGMVNESKYQRDYYVEEIEHGEMYPIDYKIEGKAPGTPLFVFGIPHKDKARLATVVLEHLLRAGVSFESLLVFANQEELPRQDLARLSNVGGEQVSSLSAYEDLKRKIGRRALLD